MKKHPPDFRVTYRFYTEKEGGRKSLPYQGYRSDFWYERKQNDLTKIFMIWPEFEDAQGRIIMDNDFFVPLEGTARMWIIDDKMRSYHKDKNTYGF